MISIHEKFSTKKHGAELFEGKDMGEDFLLYGIVVYVGFSQFMRPIRNRLMLLDDCSAHLGSWKHRYKYAIVCCGWGLSLGHVQPGLFA